MYFKETTMAEQCILKKQQWLNNVCLKKQQCIFKLNNVFFKETTMAEQCILKKQQWLNNVF